MSPYLPGHPPRAPMSLVPPLLQLGMGAALLWLGWWAQEHAQVTRATDAWAFNSLSAISFIAGVIWLPFAVTAMGIVLRNRRRMRGGRL